MDKCRIKKYSSAAEFKRCLYLALFALASKTSALHTGREEESSQDATARLAASRTS